MNPHLKSGLFFLGLLLLILFFVDFMITTGLKSSDMRDMNRVNKAANKEYVPQIAVFGSSVSEMGIKSYRIQQQTGLSVFNFSFSGTRYIQYRGLIRKLNAEKEGTRIVILAETYFSFTTVKALTAFENYLPYLTDERIYNPLYQIQPELVWKSKWVPFYKFAWVPHTYYLYSLNGWSRILNPDTRVDTLLGWTPVNRGWEVDQDEQLRKAKYFEVKIDTGIVKDYVNCIRELKAAGRTVILILPPIYTEISKKITDFSPIRKTLSSIGNAEKVPFWDFTSSQICDDKSLFYNSNHLNVTGATLFSGMIADSINQLMGPESGGFKPE